MKFKWVPWVLSILLMVFVLSRLTEYGQLSDALQEGDLRWIVVGFVFQSLYFLLLSRVYQLSFRAAGMKRSYFSIVPVVMSATFANTLTPSAGLAGTAVFVKEGRRRNHTSIRSTAGFVIETIFQQLGFIIVILAGIVYVFLSYNEIARNEGLVVLLVLAVVLVQMMMLGVAYWKPAIFEKFLKLLETVANWVVRKVRKQDLVGKDWSKRRSKELKGIVEEVFSSRKLLVPTALTAAIMQLCMLLTFVALFFAFGQELNIRAVLAVFIASGIAGTVLLGPQGIGLVEAGLTIILTHYGVPSGPAALIAITFRALNFWLPLLAGFLSFRRLRLFEED